MIRPSHFFKYLTLILLTYLLFSITDTPRFSILLEKSGFLSDHHIINKLKNEENEGKNNPKILKHVNSDEIVQENEEKGEDNNYAATEIQTNNYGIDVQNPELTMSIEDCWKLAHDWLSPREIYPDDSYFDENDNFVSRKSNEISQILHHMATAEIVAADVLPKGTQLKLILELKGK